jgi:hypothetical protein
MVQLIGETIVTKQPSNNMIWKGFFLSRTWKPLIHSWKERNKALYKVGIVVHLCKMMLSLVGFTLFT